jgi:hypothetical protein
VLLALVITGPVALAPFSVTMLMFQLAYTKCIAAEYDPIDVTI